MLKRILDATVELICVVALAVLIEGREGEKTVERQETLNAIHQFKELWLSSESAPPRWLVAVLFSDVVLNWLIERLITTARSEGFLGSPTKA